MVGGGGGGGWVLLFAKRLYYRRDQLDCPPPNGLNHYLPLNKTGAHISTGERFRATMALLFYRSTDFFRLILDQTRCFVGPDLRPNCLQILLADGTSRQS